MAKPDTNGLNAKQRKLIETALEIGFDRSIQVICKRAGVRRQTFYDWKKSPAFLRAWTEAPQLALSHHLPGVYSALVKRALQGDLPSIREVLSQCKISVSANPSGNQLHLSLNIELEAGKLLAAMNPEERDLAERAARLTLDVQRRLEDQNQRTPE